MKRKGKLSSSRPVHVHHTLANFLLPLGLAILSVLVAYWGQFQAIVFRQWFLYLLAFGIMFGALHIIVYQEKLVVKKG